MVPLEMEGNKIYMIQLIAIRVRYIMLFKHMSVYYWTKNMIKYKVQFRNRKKKQCL